MKINRAPILTLIVALTIGCAVDVRQVPAPRIGESPVSVDQRPLYLGTFDAYTSERGYLAEAWRASLMSVIRSHRVFQKVVPLPKESEAMPAEYLILDMEVRPKLNDSYNWWATWPAVYPMIAYWPIQIRTGQYAVELKYRIIDQDRQEVVSDLLKQEAETTVYFYGFFRPGAIEKMIEAANLEAMEACAKKIKQTFDPAP